MNTVRLNVLSKFPDLNVPQLFAGVKITQDGLLWRYSGNVETSMSAVEFIQLQKEMSECIHSTQDIKRVSSWQNSKGTSTIMVDAYSGKIRITSRRFQRGKAIVDNIAIIRQKGME